MLKILSKHAAIYKKYKALKDEIDNMKPAIMKALNKSPNGIAEAGGVKYNLTKSSVFVPNDAVKKKIERIKNKALEDGTAKMERTPTYRAIIPDKKAA